MEREQQVIRTRKGEEDEEEDGSYKRSEEKW